MQGLGSWNQFLKISNKRPVPPVFLEYKVPYSPPWTPFRACQRSTAAAAQSSIPAEADGKCPCCCCSVSGKMLLASKCQFIWHLKYGKFCRLNVCVSPKLLELLKTDVCLPVPAPLSWCEMERQASLITAFLVWRDVYSPLISNCLGKSPPPKMSKSWAFVPLLW